METYKVTIVGESPLLMHHDNLAFAETLARWQRDPGNKAASIAGDDRSPAWRWLGNLYQDRGMVVVPADNLMTVLREGGAKVPTGKKGATYKRQTQSGLLVNEAAWPLLVADETPVDARGLVVELGNELDFQKHLTAAEVAGFALFVKRARIGQAKHVRVRPRFDHWEISGTISVLDETITREILRLILTYAGVQCGIGDWRPSSPKSPGPFGRFRAEVK